MSMTSEGGRPVQGPPSPRGSQLVSLIVGQERVDELRQASASWPSWDLNHRQLGVLDLLVTGGFSPLTGFMNRRDYDAVCSGMRLASGQLWPMPVVLDISSEVAARLEAGANLALRDPEGVLLAALHVDEIWTPNRDEEALTLFGSTDRRHPGVAEVYQRQTHLVGGRVEGLQRPVWPDFHGLRLSPGEVRAEFDRPGWDGVVGIEPDDPPHRAEQEFLIGVARAQGVHVLLQPWLRPGLPDADSHAKVRALVAAREAYPPGMASLSLLPLAPLGEGLRQQLWHATIQKNFGCTHSVVKRVEGHEEGWAQQTAVLGYAQELGMTLVPYEPPVFVRDLNAYAQVADVPAGATVLRLSRAEVRERLARGEALPQWFAAPAVLGALARRHPPRHRRGFTVFFTGLSGSGKSTIANRLLVRLLERDERTVTLLDGDLLRKHLSSELGFSRPHREINVRRIGFVAAEITKHGGVAICAPIAPYAAGREEVRRIVEAVGGFTLVYVATPLDECERRDRKGLYARARAGLIESFTGISDPYEPPDAADVMVDTGQLTPDAAVDTIVDHLEREGYLEPRSAR
jgi:sulfate adenylyltransferase